MYILTRDQLSRGYLDMWVFLQWISDYTWTIHFYQLI